MELMAIYFLCLYSIFLAISSAYVNIALNKPTYQHYPLSPGDALFEAGNAVDGRRSDLSWDGGQCAVSDYYKQTATWWVNLTNIQSIHHITIYFMMESLFLGSFRDLATALLGFSLYVSNTTNRLQGTLCFKDDIFTKRTLPAIFNISCHIHGQYVVYYNERLPGVIYPNEYLSVVVSDLCEVEVYGCPATGYYGPNCSIPCPVTCRYCHIETGTCLGCKPGYQGHRCESECMDGKYGDGCQSDCGHCDNLTHCHHVNGTCVSGCLPGYKLEQCKEPCDGGWYGTDCNEQCGHCREENQCVNTNGACLLGCTAGYQGEICKLPCPHGYYGEDCSKRCKDTCVGCNNVNGLCESGCIAGWTGDLCQSKCMDGKYGDGCQYDCGHCDNLTQCHHGNGTCASGCLPGYKLEQCNEQCVDGKYGDGCQSDCGHCDNLTQCHHVNGTCASGCLPGYRLDHCQEPCPKGYYGRDCNEACGHCRDRSQCSHTNGTCLTGCNDGYHGEMCKGPCPHGSFGKECSKKCSETCVGCNNVNGMCDSGCVAGWTGIFCLSVDAPDMMVFVNGNGQQHFPDSKWPFSNSNNHKRQRYSMNC